MSPPLSGTVRGDSRQGNGVRELISLNASLGIMSGADSPAPNRERTHQVERATSPRANSASAPTCRRLGRLRRVAALSGGCSGGPPGYLAACGGGCPVPGTLALTTGTLSGWCGEFMTGYYEHVWCHP